MASARRAHIVILLILAMMGVFAVAQPIGGSLEAEDVAVILSARGYHGAVAKRKEQGMFGGRLGAAGRADEGGSQ